MAPLTSIRTEGNKIEIVDQLLLPHQVEWIPINSVEDAYDAIKTMKIRGAPAIASLASLAIASHINENLNACEKLGMCLTFTQSNEALIEYIQPKLDYLFTARPTAVNLGAAMRRLSKVLHDAKEREFPSMETAHAFVAEGRAIADEDVGRNKEMAKHGGEWVLEEAKRRGEQGEKVNVMTVCNTGSLATSGYGTALGLITYLHETGKLERAFYTQSTPYHQGSRLTSFELQTLGIPSTMLCDSMVGSLFQHRKVHAIAVGADRVVRNGDTANKVGTYNAAVLAARHGIPFVVVAPISTVDLDIADGSQIPIEHRPSIEAQCARGALYPPTDPPQLATVLITPSGLDEKEGVYNPSFDVTPAELISAIVTEKGVAVRGEDGKFDLSGIV
ncbi:S-methyl-5-thioribose-1-phosphate isomerase [Tulasnella sp. 427]|nr:S-methyl-5-thioribose-1-phosphate isomerase [Tulasnella sp. 427]